MIRAKQPSQETIIDLTGPDGNAFNLLGLANKLGKQLGIDTKELQANMMSGDYENLIQEFDKAFGDYVTLER
tara:strand:- start:999 stop:1214 length:216 start_codon:yes stop_codon:yes gene_type:complete